MLRIGCDLDDTVNVWMDIYLDRFGEPKNDYEITRNVQRVLSKDRLFWLSLPIKHRPDFEVTLFCTKRVNPKRWTKKWLKDNDISASAPVYQMYTQGGNKARMIKGRVDVFIDDSVKNFEDLNNSGVPCLLMDSPYNQHYDTPLRIYSLQYDEIARVYEQAFVGN